MRLLSTSAAGIPVTEEFIGSQIPRYAILSHTWDHDEVTLQQLTSATATSDFTSAPSTTTPQKVQTKAGFHKIQQTCLLARTRDGLAHAWVDTCCIDKTSSAELTEAINSMYVWYRDAAVCYVFLADLEPALLGADGNVACTSAGAAPEVLEEALPRCRWFTRGWTLQELIAPREVLFFDRDWNCRGSKKELAGLISLITGIPEPLLCGEAELADFAVARRMSWAAGRETTRVEDMAYCLLGIFDVNMSLIYGEGVKAFGRLQAAIVQTTADLSIFVWTDDRAPCPLYTGVLAESPRQFAGCGRIELEPGDSVYADFAITTRGIQAKAGLLLDPMKWDMSNRVMFDVLCRLDDQTLAVSLRKVGVGLYARYKPDLVFQLEAHEHFSGVVESFTLATRIPHHLSFNAVLGNRYSALRVSWGPLQVRRCRPKPRSHWDEYDSVLFSCSDAPGWCAFFIQALDVGRGVNVHLFLACFGWKFGTATFPPTTVFLAALDHVDSTTVRFLETQLDQLTFENYPEAHALTIDVLSGQLQGTVGEAKDDRVGVYYRSVWDAPGNTQFVRPSHGLTLGLRQESRPQICFNPTVVLEVVAASAADREV